MPPKLWICVPETTLNFFPPLMLYDHCYSSMLCLVVVASTQQIASAMCVANSLKKSTIWRAVSMQKKRILHSLAC